MNSISDTIRQYVLDDLGFDLVGFAPAARLAEEGLRLEEWLDRGYHGSMDWMGRSVDKRMDPRELLPGARSVIVVAKNYYTPHAHAVGRVKISRYAWGRDYHKILPKKLRLLERRIADLAPDAECRSFVDTGPVLEKVWAVRAGLGWMGRHTNVITTSHGSWVFLGVAITTVTLDHDEPVPDFCGDCTRCIDACPTGAIVQPYVLNANQCISFITIEQKPKEELDAEAAEAMQGWVFGCDVCQDVCPWNRFERQTDEPSFEPRPGVLDLTAEEAALLSDGEFDALFAGSPVRRSKAEGFRRNARAAWRSRLDR